MLEEGIIQEGVIVKAKDKLKPDPDLKLVARPVICEGYKAWRSLNLC
jgi:hypothetical protein